MIDKQELLIGLFAGCIGIGIVAGLAFGFLLFSKEMPKKDVYCNSYVTIANGLRTNLATCEREKLEGKKALYEKVVKEQKEICNDKRQADKLNFDVLFQKAFKKCGLKWSVK